MTDQVGMRDGLFLELLNKPNRTMQEENDLQAEIKRRQELEASQKEAQVQAEAQTTEQAIQTDPSNTEVSGQTEAVAEPARPAVDEIPVETAQPNDAPAQPQVEQPAPETQTPEVPYDLAALERDTQQAIEFLKTQPVTDSINFAISNFQQAAYWTKQASEGK